MSSSHSSATSNGGVITAAAYKSLQPDITLDIALASWRQWDAELSSQPRIVKPLSGGQSNQSFLINADGREMVLRLNGTSSVLPNADHKQESAIWRAASEKGIAPPLLHVDQQHRFLVSTYISNKLPSNPQNTRSCIDQAFKLLHQCHQLRAEAPSINYFRHIDQYWQIIDTRGHPIIRSLKAEREPTQALLKALIEDNTPTGLCHHDPITANFVGSPDRLYLIDWEYATNGLIIMDYAALGIEWKIDDKTILARTNVKPEALTAAKAIYQYLCQLWQATTS